MTASIASFRRRLAAARLGLLLCLLAAAPPAAWPVGLDRTLAQLEHVSWTARDGAPDSPTALAQTADGWLWVGSLHGLYRFDGKRFERVQPPAPVAFPDSDVAALHADAAGALWIGWRTGGVSRLRDGVVDNWRDGDGLPRGTVWGFAADGNGAGLWAAGLDGLAFFDGRAWRRIGPAEGFTAAKASSVFVAADGTVAVLSERGLFLRARGQARFAGPVATLDARQPFQQGPGRAGAPGPLYLLEEGGIRIVAALSDYARRDRPWIYRQRGPVTGSMLADRAGALWYDDEDGVHRNVDPGRAAAASGPHHAAGVESFSAAQGLSGNAVAAFLEDRDGNVWVATNNGIDRFRATDIVPLRGPVTESASLARAGRAGVLAADGARLWRLGGDGRADVVPGAAADALAVDGAGAGSLWTAGPDVLERRTADGARIVETVPAPAGASPVGKIHALARQADGTVWLSAVGGGTWRHVGGRWERAQRLPRKGVKTALSMLADARGRMWFGYIDNEVALLDGGAVRTFGHADGLDVGKVALLVEHDGMLLAGGSDGLARFDGQRFVRIAALPARALAGLAGAVSAPEGLWLNGAAGLVRLDLRAAAAGAAVPAQVFDEADGLRGRAEILQVGTLARAADGRIWVSTAKGVFWLDPAALRPETVPNRPTLLRATVDGRTHDTGQPLHLPPSPQRTAFAFAAAALAMPERLRYRYRLEGYDRAWQEAGAATEAVYTGLPPGDYRFVVQAFNGAGQAGPASRLLAVRVEATLAQTLWFRAACLLAGAAALWIVYRYRQAMRERRLLALEVARHAERDRIARELHDTLLQGVQGLMFRLDAASAGLPPQEPLRRELDAALVQAGTVLAEARDRVRDLRALDRGGADLATLLAREVARIGAEFGQACRFEAHGAPAVVADDAADACVRIVAEGVRNACRHAGAHRVDVVLAQGGGGSTVTVTVADDGRGIDPDLLRDGRPGHWGLAGMRERAAAIGARFAIRSTPGRGTVLTLELPR